MSTIPSVDLGMAAFSGIASANISIAVPVLSQNLCYVAIPDSRTVAACVWRSTVSVLTPTFSTRSSTSYENACIGQGELFYDKESESNPQAQQCNSYRFKYRYSTEVEIDLPEQMRSGLIIIRFDPDNKPCKCTISNCKPISNNCFSSNTAQETFLTFDPQYHLSGAKSIHFIANKLDLLDVISICNQINKRQTSIFGKLFHK